MEQKEFEIGKIYLVAVNGSVNASKYFVRMPTAEGGYRSYISLKRRDEDVTQISTFEKSTDFINALPWHNIREADSKEIQWYEACERAKGTIEYKDVNFDLNLELNYEIY